MDFIEVLEGVLPENFCDELIALFDRHPAVQDGVTGSGFDPDKKRSRDLTLDLHTELRTYLTRLQPFTLSRIGQYVRRYPFVLIGGVTPTLREPGSGKPLVIDLPALEQLDDARFFTLIKTIFRSGIVNLQKYPAGLGGYPHWHSEIYPQDQRCEPLHRVLFYMYYLNGVEEGGETEFYFQARKIVPRKGTLVIAPAGFTHAHRGNVPLSGDKYILTSWLMFRRAEELFSRTERQS